MLDVRSVSAMSSASIRNSMNTAKFEQYTSLQQVIELLQRLEKKSSNAEKLAEELDAKENSVGHFIKFLQDMKWVKQDNRQLWSITEQGGVWLHDIQDTMESRHL